MISLPEDSQIPLVLVYGTSKTLSFPWVTVLAKEWSLSVMRYPVFIVVDWIELYISERQ